MQATASRPKKTNSTNTVNADRLASDLAEARKELAMVHRFLEKIQTFSNIVGTAKEQLKQLQRREHDVKDMLAEIREQIKSTKDLISSSSNGMLAIIEPGPVKFMPLFDRMEKADPKTHGTNAAKWREQPLTVLKLSPATTDLLYESEILFVGQLQDAILEDPAEWWMFIEGLTAPIAAAIADKLADFANKGGAE